MTWPTGIADIQALIARGDLQQVPPGDTMAPAMLAAAARTLSSAQEIADSDPDGAYSLLYDAARKSLAAVLQTQGLRATTRGGHYAIQQAIAAQFTKPPPKAAFAAFGRLRKARNLSEYEPVSPITADDVRADLRAAQRIHEMAGILISQLTVFVV